MIKLTRGVTLRADFLRDRLEVGPLRRLTLTQVPIQLLVTVGDTCSAETGMVVNVVEISHTVRQVVSEQELVGYEATSLLRRLWVGISHKLFPIKLLCLSMTLGETLTVAIRAENKEMIQLTTKYEFAASHRLWNPAWDAQRNEAEFGQCSHASGHGHNYLLEITLQGKTRPQTGQIADLDEVDRVVQEWIIQRFDHKHLNADTEEFREVIPTVENMTKVFWELLIGRFGGAKLSRVAVWETPKTCAEYFGPSEHLAGT